MEWLKKLFGVQDAPKQMPEIVMQAQPISLNAVPDAVSHALAGRLACLYQARDDGDPRV